MQTGNSSLRIEEISNNGDHSARRGTIYRRKFRVEPIETDSPTTLNFWIEVADPKARALLSWCSLFPSPPLQVPSGKACELGLSFRIPPQAPTELYNYTLVLEATNLSQEIRRPLQLRVTPSDTDLDLGLEPEFSLEPTSTSTLPHTLEARNTLDIKVQVTNHSNLTDRYYISCPDLERTWYTPHYPESISKGLGVIEETDGLQLNPRTTGEITLSLHPPIYTPAGHYSFIVQLTSKNSPDLVLLDVIYLHVKPDETLSIQLIPESKHFPETSAQFLIQLFNSGNIQRHLTLNVCDQERLFRYLLAATEVTLTPGELLDVELKAKPRQFWRRPLRGKSVEVSFEVELSNQQSTSFPLQLPEKVPKGTIIWQSRPIWLLGLLLLLGITTVLGAAFILWFNYLRQPAPPEILTFSPIKPESPGGYKEGNRNSKGEKEQIQLSWQISNLEKMNKITLVRLERGTETHRKTYTIEPGSSEPLKSEDPDEKLECKRNVNTPPRGRSYIGLAPISLLGLRVPIPQVITSPSATLICQGIPTQTERAGDYTFQLQVFTAAQQKDPVVSRTTDTIAIKPADEPKIVEFAATRQLYEEVVGPIPAGATASRASTPTPNSSPQPSSPQASPSPQATTANAQNSSPQPSPIAQPTPPNTQQPSSPAASNTRQPVPTGVVRLNWKIANPLRVQELKLVSVSLDGSAQGNEQRYVISNNTLPPQLQPFCEFKSDTTEKEENPTLICQNVPTNVRKPGNYIFKLVAIYRQDTGTAEISRSTDAIKITPKPLNIALFEVNGQDAKTNPKQVYLVSPNGGTVNITLNWKVEGGADMRVEISPAPGLVQAQGRVTYTTSAPSSETITLKVSNSFGDEKSQSVTIQTLVSQESDQVNAPNGSTNSPSGAPGSLLPVPPPPPDGSGQPIPIELPPRSN